VQTLDLHRVLSKVTWTEQSIDDKPALLLAERGVFSTDPQYLALFAELLTYI
jgi:hypothetical protein